MLVLRLFVCSFPKFFILYSVTPVKSLLYNVGSHFWLYIASHLLKMWLLETLVIKHQIRISIGRNCMENSLTSNVHNVSFWPIMSTAYKEENHSGYVYVNSPLNSIHSTRFLRTTFCSFVHLKTDSNVGAVFYFTHFKTK